MKRVRAKSAEKGRVVKASIAESCSREIEWMPPTKFSAPRRTRRFRTLLTLGVPSTSLAFSSPVGNGMNCFLQLAPNLYPCDWMAFRPCTFIGCGHDLSVLRQDDVTSCHAPVALCVNKVMNGRTNKLQGDSIIGVSVVRHFPGASVSRYCESAFDG